MVVLAVCPGRDLVIKGLGKAGGGERVSHASLDGLESRARHMFLDGAVALIGTE